MLQDVARCATEGYSNRGPTSVIRVEGQRHNSDLQKAELGLIVEA